MNMKLLNMTNEYILTPIIQQILIESCIIFVRNNKIHKQNLKMCESIDWQFVFLAD